MNNDILNDNTVVYYVVRVNGQNVTIPTSNLAIAEMEKTKLAPDVQMVAEVVPVTADGKQVLFG